MAYDKQKLFRFKESVLKDIDTQIQNMQNKILVYKNTEIEALKNKKLNEIFNFMQDEIRNLNSHYEKKITKKKLQIKNEILVFRNNLINKIYKNLKNKILSYVQTDNYEKFLEQHLKKIVENLNLKNSVLLLKPYDLKFKEKNSIFTKFNSIKTDEKIKLGGFKIILTDQKILIDKTLDNIFECEFNNFYKNKKIILNTSEMRWNFD